VALGTPVFRGSGNTRNSSGTAQAFNPTADLNVADCAILYGSFDNLATSDGETTQLSAADAKGNIWTPVFEWTNTDGVAGDGVAFAMWKSKLTAQILTTDTLTVTSSGAVSSRTCGVDVCSIGAGLPFEHIAVTPGTLVISNETSTSFDIAYSSLASVARRGIQCSGTERGGPSWTKDADYTELTTFGTSGGAAASNQSVVHAYRLFTGTGDTATFTFSAADTRVAALVLFYEGAAAGGGSLVTPRRPGRGLIMRGRR
jgi:hypothetical protein